MTRGCRVGVVNKKQLIDRINNCNGCRRLTTAEQNNWGLRQILGHALYYDLVSEREFRETVPRDETTIPCYLRPLLQDSLPDGSTELLDRYVVTASKLYHRGSLVANYVAMRLYGPRVTDEITRVSRRYDTQASLLEARPYLEFVNPPDIRNSVFKQVFLPERWPTAQVPLHPDIEAVLVQRKDDILPSEPEGWRDLMTTSGWDNVLNRMATKLSGNVQVHCRANLSRRVGSWLGTTTSLRCGHAVPVLEDVLRGKLRPLVLHDDDWILLTDLRRTLGVSDEEPIYPPPKLAPYSDEVLALHMFVVRHGASESAYMPVTRRGRKYCYLDTKIAQALFKKQLKRGRGETQTTKKKRRTTNAASSSTVETVEAGEEDGHDRKGDAEDVYESESLGSLLGLTPEAFNAKRIRIRREITRKLSQAKRPGRRPSDFQRRLKKKRMRLGAGMMHPEAIVQSLETDGVGVRLCVKTPLDMREFIRPLPEIEENEAVTQPRKRMKRADWLAMMAAKREAAAAKEKEEREALCEQRRRDNPVTMCQDRGRKKLMATAVSTNPLKKPETDMFTRSRFYSEMRYWRHQSWSVSRAKKPFVAMALVEMSRAGGLRNCDPEIWDATLAAERFYEDILDEEFVESPDYSVWRMRMFRLKRASLDRATFKLLKRAMHGQPSGRGLVVGVGDGSFCSTGKGALSAPTNSLDRAMARSIQRFRDIQKHKNKERKKKNMPRLPERKVEFQVVQEYGSTMCCCACGQLTEPALVTIRDQNTGEMTTRRSRRLRLCTTCDPTDGKRRDRDVQGARNLLWIMKLEYMGGDRPWYLTRKGRREMENALVTSAPHAATDPVLENIPEGSYAMVTSSSP